MIYVFSVVVGDARLALFLEHSNSAIFDTIFWMFCGNGLFYFDVVEHDVGENILSVLPFKTLRIVATKKFCSCQAMFLIMVSMCCFLKKKQSFSMSFHAILCEWDCNPCSKRSNIMNISGINSCHRDGEVGTFLDSARARTCLPARSPATLG